MKYYLVYFALVSIVAVIITVIDKRRACKHRYRIRESVLLLVAALGGSVSMLLTMLLIRHKINHMKFMLGIPLIILAQLTVILFVWRMLYG